MKEADDKTTRERLPDCYLSTDCFPSESYPLGQIVNPAFDSKNWRHWFCSGAEFEAGCAIV